MCHPAGPPVAIKRGATAVLARKGSLRRAEKTGAPLRAVRRCDGIAMATGDSGGMTTVLRGLADPVFAKLDKHNSFD